MIAADIDPFAIAAIARNAKANALAIETVDKDMIGSGERFDLILIGDMCYERPLAERLMAWLKETPADMCCWAIPAAPISPRSGLTQLATYNVPTTRELEDREIRETGVWRLDGPGLMPLCHGAGAGRGT